MSILRRKHQQKHTARRILLGAAATSIVLFVLLVAGALTVVVSAAGEIPRLENQGARPVALTTKVYATDGRWIADLHAEQDRVVIPLKLIPDHLQEAIVAIEDERFYGHSGVDVQGILRALLANLERGGVVEGGSTITQQYIKNTYLTSERTLDRKIREAALAYQIEQKMSKEEILERYLNTIYFGQDSYGVATASITYFGKLVTELTVSESAMLAGLIRAPRRYSPYTNPAAAKARRDQVLRRMVALEYLAAGKANKAMAEPVKVAPLKPVEPMFAPYFVEYVKQQLIREYGANAVFRGGLRVYTTLDPKMQTAAEKAVEGVLNRKGDPSASLVAIESKTGYIRAMYGGRDFNQRKFNLAAQGKRQTGSSFKIFVLSTWVASKRSLSDVFVSAPQTIAMPKPQKPWRVNNYDHRYRGAITVQSATILSDNSVYAQMIMELGADKVVKTAKTMGITSDLKPYPAIALGGLEWGVSALEMASAAATLSNDGVSNEPLAIIRVKDSEGNVLQEIRPKSSRALRSEVARTVTSVLRQALERGTGRRAKIDRPAAGKTGTAQDYRDAWFVGYTPNLAAAVWMGYPQAQREMRNVHGIRVAGGTFPAQMWGAFMGPALAGTPKTDFEPAPKQKAKSRSYPRKGKPNSKESKKSSSKKTGEPTSSNSQARNPGQSAPSQVPAPPPSQVAAPQPSPPPQAAPKPLQGVPPADPDYTEDD